jgi:threonine/homoserine/homoserine lactone efflux protein
MMTADQMLALTVFAAVSSGTPGPNNLMLMTSGVNFGMKRSIPHLMGITLGFCFMIFAVGMGLQAMFTAIPQLEVVLRYVGTAYLLWLAWKIAHSGPIASGSSSGSGNGKSSGAKPMGFWAAAAFQWVNPKAWFMAISAITTYASSAADVAGGTSKLSQVLLVVLIFGVVNFPLVACWGLFGSAMRRFLQDPKKLKIFNVTMALLLVASLYPIVQPMIQSLF